MIVTSRYQSCAARSCSAGDRQVTAVVVQHQLDFFTSRRYQLPKKSHQPLLKSKKCEYATEDRMSSMTTSDNLLGIFSLSTSKP
jgi:hypothetical protein